MSGIDDALIDDVRALLANFCRSGLADFTTNLRPGVELTIRRDAPPITSHRTLVAPHVATILQLPEGRTVAVGISLEVLGTEIILPLDEGEFVAEYLVSVGDLVEYGTPIARLSRP